VKLAYDGAITGGGERLDWIKEWGTAITLAITAEDQSGFNPGASLITPFENRVFTFPTGGAVTSSQSFSVGLGASVGASATRTETIQFTVTNEGLLRIGADLLSKTSDFNQACKIYQEGAMIEGDLKIWEFIYDKAFIAANSNASTWSPEKIPTGMKDAKGNPKYKTVYGRHPNWPLYNTFTENISFVATFSGNVTPTWKLARVAANSTGNLLSATRTNTNQLTLTMGPIESPGSATSPPQLKQGAQQQHDNTVLSNSIKTPQN
jgi:hypothetical protein